MTLLDIARLFRFVRELPQNKGQRVEAIQRWCGGTAGDSWCAYMLTMWLDLFYQGQSPIPRLGACQDIYALAKRNGWLVTEPEPEDVFLYVTDDDHAHHCGLVTVSHPLTGIAGNTDATGTSNNGDRVAEHYLLVKPERIRFVRLPSP